MKNFLILCLLFITILAFSSCSEKVYQGAEYKGAHKKRTQYTEYQTKNCQTYRGTYGNRSHYTTSTKTNTAKRYSN